MMLKQPSAAFASFLEPLLAPHGKILDALRLEGGHPLVIGGSVRDALLGIVPRDLDIEVFNMSAPCLEQVLGQFGAPLWRGKAFGVYLLNDVAYALPREEHKIGPGHRGFEVVIDPNLSFQESARRRDLTINAMAYDPATGNLMDPYGGQEDLARHCLRCVRPETFVEDPLRALRVAQFASRFHMAADDELIELCRALSLNELPSARIQREMEKIFRAPFPSLGLSFLEKTGLADFLGLVAMPPGLLESVEGEDTLMERLALVRLGGVDSQLQCLKEFMPSLFHKESALLSEIIRTLHALRQAQASRGTVGLVFDRISHQNISFESIQKVYGVFYGSSALDALMSFLEVCELPPSEEEKVPLIRGSDPRIQALPPGEERKRRLERCRFLQYERNISEIDVELARKT